MSYILKRLDAATLAAAEAAVRYGADSPEAAVERSVVNAVEGAILDRAVPAELLALARSHYGEEFEMLSDIGIPESARSALIKLDRVIGGE